MPPPSDGGTVLTSRDLGLLEHGPARGLFVANRLNIASVMVAVTLELVVARPSALFRSTRPATPFSLIDVRIGIVVFVSLGTLAARGILAAHILCTWDDFKVVRAHASPFPTQVVDRHSRRDWTSQHFPGEPMGVTKAPQVPVSAGVQGAKPHPAGAREVHAVPEPPRVLQRNVRAHPAQRP